MFSRKGMKDWVTCEIITNAAPSQNLLGRKYFIHKFNFQRFSHCLWLPSEMPTSELPTSRQIWGRHYYNNSSSEMPTLFILLHFQMWMPGSSSIWLVGGQKLLLTTSNQPRVEWDKGFPTKYFFNTMYCTLQWWILNLVHMYFKKILSAQHRKIIRFLAMCAAKAAKRIWRRQCGQDAI